MTYFLWISNCSDVIPYIPTHTSIKSVDGNVRTFSLLSAKNEKDGTDDNTGVGVMISGDVGDARLAGDNDAVVGDIVDIGDCGGDVNPANVIWDGCCNAMDDVFVCNGCVDG